MENDIFSQTWSPDAQDTNSLVDLVNGQHPVNVRIEHQEYLFEVSNYFIIQIPLWIFL